VTTDELIQGITAPLEDFDLAKPLHRVAVDSVCRALARERHEGRTPDRQLVKVTQVVIFEVLRFKLTAGVLAGTRN